MPCAGMGLDAGIHHGLGVARLVALVMPKTAKPDEVKHDVLAKLASIIQCDLDDAVGRFGVVAIYMKDRRLGDMGGIGRIDRRAPELGRCCKTDLIIDDQMDRAASAVAGQAGKLERFHHDALAGKGRVAVKQERQDLAVNLFASFLFAVAKLILAGTGHAFDYGIYGFEMARITRKLYL